MSDQTSGQENIVLRDVDEAVIPSHAVAATGEARFSVELPTSLTPRERLMRLHVILPRMGIEATICKE